MKWLHSIRWRLQIWHGMLLIAALGGFGVAAYHVQSERLFRRVDEESQRRLQILSASKHPMPNARPPRQRFSISPENAALFDQEGSGGFYYIVWLHGSEPQRSKTAPADAPMPGGRDTPGSRERGMLREKYLLPAPDDCLLVGCNMAHDLADLHQLAWWLAGAGGGVVLLGLIGGSYMVRRALKPIGDISDAAQKVATGDLSQRIAGSASGSELGLLVNVLNSTFARLDAAFTQQAHFSADAAHELRTPVSVVLAEAQYGLDTACTNDEHRESFDAIHRAANRMRRLIESLLQLARLDSGQETSERGPCDLAALAADCLESVRSMASGRNIEIHADLSHVTCTCHADRISQVITNLLTNAVYYNHDGGQIHVGTLRDADMAALIVQNTGPEIDGADLPHIFERFYRADKARTSSSGRTGLGLAIAKAIVQSHGGSIDVASSAESGTRFTVRLPT
jgi:two-component system, OmpR family, sensor kinase